MTLVGLPIDEDLRPLVDRLQQKAIDQYKSGKNPAKLNISPRNNRYAGRLALLLGERFSSGDTGYRASVSSWTGPQHCGVIEVRFFE